MIEHRFTVMVYVIAVIVLATSGGCANSATEITKSKVPDVELEIISWHAASQTMDIRLKNCTNESIALSFIQLQSVLHTTRMSGAHYREIILRPARRGSGPYIPEDQMRRAIRLAAGVTEGLQVSLMSSYSVVGIDERGEERRIEPATLPGTLKWRMDGVVGAPPNEDWSVSASKWRVRGEGTMAVDIREADRLAPAS